MKTRSMIMGFMALGAAVLLLPDRAQASEYCREYTRTVTIGNQQQVAYGTACYQPNGDWKIVDEDDRSRIGQRFRDEDVGYRTVYQQPVYRPVYQPVYQPYYYRPPVRSSIGIVFISDNDRHDRKHYNRGRGHGRHDDRHDGRHDGRHRNWN